MAPKHCSGHIVCGIRGEALAISAPLTLHSAAWMGLPIARCRCRRTALGPDPRTKPRPRSRLSARAALGRRAMRRAVDEVRDVRDPAMDLVGSEQIDPGFPG